MALLFPANMVLTSAKYNGSTSDVNLGSPAHLDDIGAQTVIAVFREDGDHESNFGYLWGKTPSASTAGPRFFLGTGTSNQQRLTFGASSSGTAGQPSKQTDGTTAYARGAWYFSAFTWDGSLNHSGINLYLAKLGEQLALPAQTGINNGTTAVSSDASNNAHIGNRQNTDRTINGQIGYVAVYAGVLSAAELQNLHLYGHNPGDPRLRLLWANGRDWSAYKQQASSQTAVAQGVSVDAKFLNLEPLKVYGFSVTGGQTLTPSLFTNTSTFHAATVTPGAVTLTPALVENSNTFYTHTIGQDGGAQTLTASLFTNSNTFHAATVANVFEIDDNYERSSVKLADSSISGTGDSAVITIKPRFQSSEVTSGEARWLEPSALVRGLNGYRPTFRFSSYLTSGTGSYHGQPWQAGRRPMFSYDRSTWTYFDTAVTVDTTNHWVEFRHSTAFTSNTVYISRSRQISVEQTGAWIDDLETTYPAIIEPTTSAAAFTPTLTSWSGQSFIADEFSSQTNELSETIPATPFYAFQINDTSLTPLDGSAKQLAVVTSGVHAGEDHGNFVLKAFIDAVLDSTTTGQYLRRNYKILVYPMINAPGRAGGGWRGSFTLGTGSIDDANRHFSDASPGLEIITKPRTAMATDRGSETPHWAIDFHGTYANAWALFVDTGNTFQDTFKTLLGTNSGQTIADEGDTHAGFVSRYYQDTVGSRLAITHESGDPSQVTDANIVTQGVGIADSLYDIFQIVAPSAFTNTSTFHAPTVTPGAVTLTPSLVENTSTFYAATISQPSTQTLTASLLQNSNTFYAHVIANVTPTVRRVGGGGYLVELDGKRKQPSPSISDDEEIMEILAAIMPAIEAQRFAMGRVQ